MPFGPFVFLGRLKKRAAYLWIIFLIIDSNTIAVTGIDIAIISFRVSSLGSLEVIPKIIMMPRVMREINIPQIIIFKSVLNSKY